MRINFKLFATLSGHLPRELDGLSRVGNELPMDVAEGTTVQAVIDRFALPRQLVHLVLVNGNYVPPGMRAGQALREGDALAVWPPIAGG